MTRGLYITVLGNAVQVNLAGLTEWQLAVGGLVEEVKIQIQSQPCAMFTNEEGLFLCPVINERASEIAGRTIVGDVFILGRTDGNGRTLGLTPRAMDWLLSHLRSKEIVHPRALRLVRA